MKKIRVMLSMIAFAMAVAGAFAFTIAPRTGIPTYINTVPNPDTCEDADVECEGGTEDCTKLVPVINQNKAIWDNSPTGCKFRLKMQ